MNYKGMWTRQSAGDWEEAFPGGNGRTAVLVMGNPATEKIIVNHERLFLPMTGRVVMPDLSANLPEIRRQIQSGQYDEAAAYFVEKATEQGLYPGIGPDYFHPAFDLDVDMPPRKTVSDCLRSLDFTTGEITTAWRDGTDKLERRLFVSRPDDVIVISISATEGYLPSCKFRLSDSGTGTKAEAEDRQKYLFNSDISATDELLTFQGNYRNGGGYTGAACIIPTGGTIKNDGKKIIVENAENILVLAAVSPNLNIPELTARLNKITSGYEALFEKHKIEHGELFNRVSLDLDDSDDRKLSNEELLAGSNADNVSNALAERMHDYGRYLLICSAGELPPNAQGIWNGTWKISNLVDYVTNIELEMATWPALQGALPECLNGYFNFIESFVEDWHDNAMKLYGCRGILASSRSSNHGQLHHFSARYPHEFWTAGAGWMVQTFYDYYLFTGDHEFLLKRALPLMKEVALFYEDFLIEDDNGALQFIPSVSPENNPGNSVSQATRNATMDIAVARELLTNLIKICEDSALEPEGVNRWQKLLAKLPEYQVNPDGSLREWCAPELTENYPHRHLSHLYPAMPGFEAEHNATLAEACGKAIDMRMENGLLRRCGWSLGHAVNAAARLKNGAMVHKLLSTIAVDFVKPALFTLLDHDLGMFQVDANLGFCSAVMEALVFSLSGELELLPALPRQWQHGSITGISCRGQLVVKKLEWDLQTGSGSAILSSDVSQCLTLKIAGKTLRHVELAGGQPLKISFKI